MWKIRLKIRLWLARLQYALHIGKMAYKDSYNKNQMVLRILQDAEYDSSVAKTLLDNYRLESKSYHTKTEYDVRNKSVIITYHLES